MKRENINVGGRDGGMKERRTNGRGERGGNRRK